MIKILAVGKKVDRNLVDAINDYQKRLRPPFNVNWVYVPYSARGGLEARQNESEALLKHVSDDDYVVLLDERGKQITNIDLSNELSTHKNTVVVIGGAYGVDDNLRQRANLVLSLSKLVFPHQLVRLILIEQIYRSQAIYNGLPYHHE